MLISRRRIYWASVLTLLCVICVLVRPMRSWIDRAIVTATTRGAATVDQLHLHVGDSVIEAKGLSIHRHEDQRKFGMVAAKTWIAIDGVGMIDRRLNAPTVMIEDAVVYLKDDDTVGEIDPPSDAWQTQLARKLSGITWDKLKEHFTTLLAADDLVPTLDGRIETWLRTSDEILRRLRDIESETVDRDNPLRYEDDVQERLVQIEKLRLEQEKLVRHFESARSTLEAEVKLLEQQAYNKADDFEKQAFAAAAIEADMQGMASEILTASGQVAWKRFADYCEVASRMAEVKLQQPTPPWNKSIRRQQAPLVDLPSIKVAGHFERGLEQVPFSVLGSYSSTDGVSLDRTSWDYTFFEQTRTVQLDLMMASPQAQSISVLATQEHDVSPDSAGGRNSTGQTVLDGDIAVNEGKLSGQVKIYAQALATRPSAGGRNLARIGNRQTQILATAMRRRGDDVYIIYDVSGSWRAPSLQPTQPAEDWLIDQIRESISPNLQQAVADATSRLNSEVRGRLERLKHTAQLAASGSTSITEPHRNPLFATRNRLQASLDEINSTLIRR